MAQEKDVVLIYHEDKPLTFARIEDIQPDVKPDWYHVRLLLLQIPLQPVTWILRTAYIDGGEFTMNGDRMRLEPVVSPEVAPDGEDSGEMTETGEKGDAKVISFADLKRK
ncbi:hypothetical protein DENIS_3955 [Desulfonema ishimotonii]|uniref:Uncharacterized protein n=1 Tax=Desulfonema ishimotonii TaxID=45657 RepID=A0A401G168_9BACT|nr:hypothetical protein [Desulfonema ishimotonii]GBC62969.1 hypothetical protein DENIS_3955 [Desulfonema ishimotonii]